VCLGAALVVELDGSQHVAQAVYDRERDAFLRARGYRVLRFWNQDVRTRTDSVMDTILEALLSADMDGRFDGCPLRLERRGTCPKTGEEIRFFSAPAKRGEEPPTGAKGVFCGKKNRRPNAGAAYDPGCRPGASLPVEATYSV